MNIFSHRKRLEIQGFRGYSDRELVSLTFGIRFAYIVSTILVALGLIFTSIPLLMVVFVGAFLGVILPRHPFDYLYNHIVRHSLKKETIPTRTSQNKFTFGVAMAWLFLITFLFYNGFFIWGYFAGGVLMFVAILVSTTDICIPSMIYNFLFQKMPSIISDRKI